MYVSNFLIPNFFALFFQIIFPPKNFIPPPPVNETFATKEEKNILILISDFRFRF